MKAIAGLGVMLALGACGYSVDEVQEAPVALSVKVPAAWDSVGTCIAQFYTGEFQTTYLPVASERRAKIIVQLIGPGIIQYRTIMYIFEVSGGDQTTVVYRRRPIGLSESSDRTTRETIERCGKV